MVSRSVRQGELWQADDELPAPAIAPPDGPRIRCRRTRNRGSRFGHHKDEPDIVYTTPAEYGLYRGNQQLCRIVRTGDGWRAVVVASDGSFGEAVSPVGLNGWRQVRDWAVAWFSRRDDSA